MDRCLIHCFSGTGCGYHASVKLASLLQDKGIKPVIHRMEKGCLSDLNKYNLHIFIYPVYSFSIPQIVAKYLEKTGKSLKKAAASPEAAASSREAPGSSREAPGSSPKAAVIAICAGEEGAALYQGSRILSKSGYKVICAKRVVYPSNWVQFFSAPDAEETKRIVCDAEKELPVLADEILRAADSSIIIKGKRKVNQVDLIDRLPDSSAIIKGKPAVGMLLLDKTSYIFRLVGRRILGKLYFADSSCTGCRKCVNECPAHTIKMVGTKKKIPVWGLDCECCQRCINSCPSGSIQVSFFALVIQLLMFFIPMVLYFMYMPLLLKSAWLSIAIFIAILIPASFALSFLADKITGIMANIPGLKKLVHFNASHRLRKLRL